MSRPDKFLRDNPKFGVGQASARDDIANGHLGWKEHGKMVPWYSEITDQLWRHYSIRFSVVGDCITPVEVAAEAAGYNEEMKAEITRRFGANVVDTVIRDIERKKRKVGA